MNKKGKVKFEDIIALILSIIAVVGGLLMGWGFYLSIQKGSPAFFPVVIGFFIAAVGVGGLKVIGRLPQR